MDISCKRCRYAAFCVPRGAEKFFSEVNEAILCNGMSNSAETLRRAIWFISTFQASLPEDCPQHPRKELMSEVLQKMQI
jgi:hypothetical protein